jgi:flavin-dependent dehydrogenase
VAARGYDVIVAGGGPGGSTVAGRLVQAGARVLVLEKEVFPRFHLGESLLPMSLAVFDELGVTRKLDARFIRKHGARFVKADTGEEVSFKFANALCEGHPHAFHGPRGDIDHVLLDHAAELGAEVRQGWTVRGFLKEGDRVAGVATRGPDGTEEHVAARVVVDATGRDALASRRAGAKIKTPRLERTLAVFSHFDGCQRLRGDDEGDIRIVIAKEGWFWVIPFRGDRTSVGIVLEPHAMGQAAGDLNGLLSRLCAASAPMRAIMGGARQVFPAQAVADFSYRVPRASGNGWLAVGDAGGFIDPLFSTGFHLAVKGADLAARAIVDAFAVGDVSEARWQTFERLVKTATETYVGVVQAFYDGPLIELLFDEGQRDMMRRMITSVLAGDVFHEEKPRWLREVERRYPARLGSGEEATQDVG